MWLWDMKKISTNLHYKWIANKLSTIWNVDTWFVIKYFSPNCITSIFSTILILSSRFKEMSQSHIYEIENMHSTINNSLKIDETRLLGCNWCLPIKIEIYFFLMHTIFRVLKVVFVALGQLKIGNHWQMQNLDKPRFIPH